MGGIIFIFRLGLARAERYLWNARNKFTFGVCFSFQSPRTFSLFRELFWAFLF